MAKIGRNDLCPCGSGKKYKKCCLASDEAAARSARPVQQAAVPARRASLAGYVQEHDELDELTEASNAVVDMVQAGNLDAPNRPLTNCSRASPMSMTATTASAWSAKPAAIVARPPTTTAAPSTSSVTTPTTTIPRSRACSKGSSTGSSWPKAWGLCPQKPPGYLTPNDVQIGYLGGTGGDANGRAR
jgi:hypothetical protein